LQFSLQAASPEISGYDLVNSKAIISGDDRRDPIILWATGLVRVTTRTFWFHKRLVGISYSREGVDRMQLAQGTDQWRGGCEHGNEPWSSIRKQDIF